MHRKGVCSTCGPVDLRPNGKRHGKRTWMCPVRHRAYGRVHYSRMDDSAKEARRTRAREREYGLSEGERAKMLDAQQGLCAICQREIEVGHPDRKHLAVIDHDHNTEEVRGMLCWTCNVGLGQLGDDPDILKSALLYLEGEDAILYR